MKAVLNYVEPFGMQHGVSFSEAFVKDTITDMMLLRYLLKRTRSSYVRYESSGRLLSNMPICRWFRGRRLNDN